MGGGSGPRKALAGCSADCKALATCLKRAPASKRCSCTYSSCALSASIVYGVVISKAVVRSAIQWTARLPDSTSNGGGHTPLKKQFFKWLRIGSPIGQRPCQVVLTRQFLPWEMLHNACR
jgi:hypothetical protein